MNHKKLHRLYAEERQQVRRRGGRKRALGNAGADAIPKIAIVMSTPTIGSASRNLAKSQKHRAPRQG